MKCFCKWLMVLILALPASMHADGWNTTVTTTSTIEYISSSCFSTKFVDMDLFVNADGLHLVVEDDDGISYKKFNASGVLQTSATISTAGVHPNIVGDEDDLYILYGSGSNLYIRTSSRHNLVLSRSYLCRIKRMDWG